MRYDPFDIFGNTEDIKDGDVKDYSFKRNAGDEYRPEDASAQSLRLHISSNKLNLFLVVIFLGLTLLVIRSGLLQMAHGQEYRAMAEENRIRIQRIKPPRGVIYDRNEMPLVNNVANFVLKALPYDLPEDNNDKLKIFQRLNEYVDITDEKIIQIANIDEDQLSVPITLAENIDINTAIILRILSGDLPGVYLEAESSRQYTGGNSFSHILGYIGKINNDELAILKDQDYLLNDQTGKTGLELSYENILRGKYGRKHVEVDSLGKVKKIVASEDPQPGQDLILTIDINYQNKLQELLDEKVNSLKTSGGAAIAMDPRNGEILAIVSSPSYDNNLFTGQISNAEYNKLILDESNPLFPRAVSGEYPSGSTIKPMIAAAALADGNISGSTQILSTGGISIDKWFFPDWKSGGHGLTDVRKALAESVNTFFYTIGGGYQNIDGLGVERIREYAELFGLNNKLGIDLPNESRGFFPSKEWKNNTKGEAWYIGDTYHLAIGQGDLLVTPLQIASMTSTIANGGNVYTPHVVRAVADRLTGNLEYNEPVAKNEKIIDNKYLSIVRQGLRDAVTYGSAVSLSQLNVTAAGKTGTAQYSKDKTHAWFTGFAPYENPEIVITVIVEGGGEGHATALPVAKDFLTWYYGEK